jgi:hypothetical protein
MLFASAIQGMKKYKEALLEDKSASNPSAISENTHRLTQYLSALDDMISDMEEELELKEAKSFLKHVDAGKSANAAKELTKREFIKDRTTIKKTNRQISSGWNLVNECQSRVKHLIAEATNQI